MSVPLPSEMKKALTEDAESDMWEIICKKQSNKFDVKFAQSSMGWYYNLPPIDDIMSKVQTLPDGRHIKTDPSAVELLKLDIEYFKE
jgi:hypothetical protein